MRDNLSLADGDVDNERFSRSADHTVNAQKWLQIGGDLVASWPDAHVREGAQGEVSFELPVAPPS